MGGSGALDLALIEITRHAVEEFAELDAHN
jgi:hypothetical protein